MEGCWVLGIGEHLCKFAPHEREALAIVGLLGIPQNDAVAVEEDNPHPCACASARPRSVWMNSLLSAATVHHCALKIL